MIPNHESHAKTLAGVVGRRGLISCEVIVMVSGLQNVAERAVTCLIAALVAVPAGMGQVSRPELTVTRVAAMDYPVIARMAYLEGTVELVASVSREGMVVAVKVVSGPPLLADPERGVLSKWRFKGCDLQGGCEVKVVFSFALPSTCEVGLQCPTEFEADLPARVEVRSGRWVGHPFT
jgi:hypothetical protein